MRALRNALWFGVLLRNSRTTEPRRRLSGVPPPYGGRRSRPCALLRNSRTTDSPAAAKSAELLFRLAPRLAACALLTSSCSLQAEIIDRIAVSVDTQVITEGQIREEIRVTAFLNHQSPELGAAARRSAAERLIEQTLIRREIEFSRYPLPGMAAADQSFQSVESEYGSESRFEQALQDCGITEQDLRRHLWWQLAVARFIDSRFAPGVQVSDADVKAYYDQQLVKWQQQGVEPLPSLDDSRAKIEQTLTQQRVDQALDRWLGDTRTQVEIRYHPGAFE